MYKLCEEIDRHMLGITFDIFLQSAEVGDQHLNEFSKEFLKHVRVVAHDVVFLHWSPEFEKLPLPSAVKFWECAEDVISDTVNRTLPLFFSVLSGDNSIRLFSLGSYDQGKLVVTRLK